MALRKPDRPCSLHLRFRCKSEYCLSLSNRSSKEEIGQIPVGDPTTKHVDVEKYKTNTNGKTLTPVHLFQEVLFSVMSVLERRLPLGTGCNLRTKPWSASRIPDPTHSVPLTMLMQFAEQEGQVFQYQSQDGSIIGRLPWHPSRYLTRNSYCGDSVSDWHFIPSYLLHRSCINTSLAQLSSWRSSTKDQKSLTEVTCMVKLRAWCWGAHILRGGAEIKPRHASVTTIYCSCLRHCYHCASLDFRYHYLCLGVERKSELQSQVTQPSWGRQAPSRLLSRGCCFPAGGRSRVQDRLIK